MTPKEKAQDLFKKFHDQCNCTIAGCSTIFIQIAKGCALIAVDEVLSELAVHGVECYYWQRVKVELQIL